MAGGFLPSAMTHASSQSWIRQHKQLGVEHVLTLQNSLCPSCAMGAPASATQIHTKGQAITGPSVHNGELLRRAIAVGSWAGSRRPKLSTAKA